MDEEEYQFYDPNVPIDTSLPFFSLSDISQDYISPVLPQRSLYERVADTDEDRFAARQFSLPLGGFQNSNTSQYRLPAGSLDADGNKIGGQFSFAVRFSEAEGKEIGEYIKQCLLKNYETLNIGTPTGTLRKSIENAEVYVQTTQGKNPSLAVTVKLSDEERPEREYSSQDGGRVYRSAAFMTSYYGPLVFFGRRAFTTESNMAFMGNKGKVVKTKSVAASEPKNIFHMDDEQIENMNQMVQSIISRVKGD